MLSVEVITDKRSFATTRIAVDISKSYRFIAGISLSIFFAIVY